METRERLPCGFQGSNSSCKARWQVPLPDSPQNNLSLKTLKLYEQEQKWEVTFTNHVATVESLKPEELPGSQAGLMGVALAGGDPQRSGGVWIPTTAMRTWRRLFSTHIRWECAGTEECVGSGSLGVRGGAPSDCPDSIPLTKMVQL